MSVVRFFTGALRRLTQSKDLSVVAFIIAILAIIIIPLPPIVLDFLLIVSIALSILIILIGLYITKPTDFSSFPTLLLIVTLYRLALNIATTRMILTKGHEGPMAVSDIITSFGEFTVQGNYVIGFIVFSILILTNLLVVTNGSTRVTEVRARFALDAMPGKQMAIDADLNAGLIDNQEAKNRRAVLSQEADFYGAMDGASKFVKGDAIAAIIITIINIVGGFLIGIFQRNLSFSESAAIFSILTIGDGLVSQIPALIIATATGIVATRTTQGEDENFASKLVNQLTNKSKILAIVAIIFILGSTLSGLPSFSMLFVGSLLFLTSWIIGRQDKESLFSLFERWITKNTHPSLRSLANQRDAQKQHAPISRVQKTQEDIKKEEEKAINEVLKIELLELELGYGLVPLADIRQNGELLERVRGIRKKIAQDYGFLMPQIRIRDNLQFSPNQYQIKLKGIPIGESNVFPDKFLAMSTGFIGKEVKGIPTKEPAFGMDALWIESQDKEEAILQGYTVIDPSTVITTHMSELVKNYAEEFITKDEVKSILDRLSETYPTIVEEAKKIQSGVIRSVLQDLLHEKIPIKDMVSILETITDVAAPLQNDISLITEQVRTKLSRVITNTFKSEDGTLKLLTLNVNTEQYLLGKIREQPGGRVLLLNTIEMQKMIDIFTQESLKILKKGIAPVVLVVDPMLRRVLSMKLEQFKIDLVILSHTELDINTKYEILGSIEIQF